MLKVASLAYWGKYRDRYYIGAYRPSKNNFFHRRLRISTIQIRITEPFAFLLSLHAYAQTSRARRNERAERKYIFAVNATPSTRLLIRFLQRTISRSLI